MKNFKKEVVDAYTQHTASDTLPANLCMARSLIPPGTGAYRDFSSIASELPHFISQNCVGCMACVVECPDTAILGKVVEEDVLKEALKENESLKTEFTKTTKYYTTYEKRGRKPGLFQIAIDPTKCKGCGECVTVCGDHNALKMVSKSETVLKETGQKFDFFKKLPPTPKDFIQEKILSDFMLSPDALLYVGGAGSCMGCGEATGIRMMLAATGFVHGQHSCGIVAATGCNTVYGSTYPYNPYLVSWTNSLFENACAVAMGIRARWDQQGLHPKKLWVLGGDGAMLDIGFQSLSRLLMSGLDINILVLDTQAYSNTGGQASTATFTSQNAKMAAHGSKLSGKSERRKELSNIALMHPDVYVAQTVTSMTTHFYQAILRANEFPGPALVNVYASCPPEHGIRDNAASEQSKAAVTSRAFPLLTYDPHRGEKLKERLSLKGNPAATQDWYIDPKTKNVFDFTAFAKTEGRFSKQFDANGSPSLAMKAAQEDRLKNWHLLQELAGLRA